MNRFFAIACAISVLAACSPIRRFQKEIQTDLTDSPVFSGAFTGFVLLDPTTGKTLFEQNGSRFFTPASNTKIYTLYDCLKILPDSLPAIRWQTDGENLFFEGLADPTFLHPTLGKLCPTADFLKNRPEKNLLFSPYNFHSERFGTGWAWDDAPFDYQAEKSSLPIYGNLMTARGSQPTLFPARFQLYLNPKKDGPQAPFIQRDEFGNRLFVPAKAAFSTSFEQKIPIFWQNTDFNLFLKDTLGRVVSSPAASFFEKLSRRNWQILPGAPLDSVLREMMLPSDNFIAEQLLLACAAKISDSLRTEIALDFADRNLFADLPDRPRLFDGSGLSRYNLTTPRNTAALLLKIWKEQPRERVLNLFAAGGSEGTIRDFYKPQPGETTWLFAKTGTLGGVHCLSGFLLTDKHNVLIFSFMHNNFVGPSKPYKLEMERVLRKIKARF